MEEQFAPETFDTIHAEMITRWPETLRNGAETLTQHLTDLKATYDREVSAREDLITRLKEKVAEQDDKIGKLKAELAEVKKVAKDQEGHILDLDKTIEDLNQRIRDFDAAHPIAISSESDDDDDDGSSRPKKQVVATGPPKASFNSFAGFDSDEETQSQTPLRPVREVVPSSQVTEEKKEDDPAFLDSAPPRAVSMSPPPISVAPNVPEEKEKEIAPPPSAPVDKLKKPLPEGRKPAVPKPKSAAAEVPSVPAPKKPAEKSKRADSSGDEDDAHVKDDKPKKKKAKKEKKAPDSESTSKKEKEPESEEAGSDEEWEGSDLGGFVAESATPSQGGSALDADDDDIWKEMEEERKVFMATKPKTLAKQEFEIAQQTKLAQYQANKAKLLLARMNPTGASKVPEDLPPKEAFEAKRGKVGDAKPTTDEAKPKKRIVLHSVSTPAVPAPAAPSSSSSSAAPSADPSPAKPKAEKRKDPSEEPSAAGAASSSTEPRKSSKQSPEETAADKDKEEKRSMKHGFLHDATPVEQIAQVALNQCEMMECTSGPIPCGKFPEAVLCAGADKAFASGKYGIDPEKAILVDTNFTFAIPPRGGITIAYRGGKVGDTNVVYLFKNLTFEVRGSDYPNDDDGMKGPDKDVSVKFLIESKPSDFPQFQPGAQFLVLPGPVAVTFWNPRKTTTGFVTVAFVLEDLTPGISEKLYPYMAAQERADRPVVARAFRWGLREIDSGRKMDADKALGLHNTCRPVLGMRANALLAKIDGDENLRKYVRKDKIATLGLKKPKPKKKAVKSDDEEEEESS